MKLSKADRHKSRTRVSLNHYAKKSKVWRTDEPTDRRTDAPTDGPTNTVAYRVACTRLKSVFWSRPQREVRFFACRGRPKIWAAQVFATKRFMTESYSLWCVFSVYPVLSPTFFSEYCQMLQKLQNFVANSSIVKNTCMSITESLMKVWLLPLASISTF